MIVNLPSGTYDVTMSFYPEISEEKRQALMAAVKKDVEAKITRMLESMGEKTDEPLDHSLEYTGIGKIVGSYTMKVPDLMNQAPIQLEIHRGPNLEAPAGNSKPKCDCGAHKVKTTHAYWCSAYEK